MTTERFSLDTDVLVYAADLAAGERHARALEILDRAVRRECLLTLQALAEFFHVTTRGRMVARADAAAQLRDWATEFPTVSADPGALWMALEIAVDGRLSLWDALLLATAERHACEIVLSKDMQDGVRFGGVTTRLLARYSRQGLLSCSADRPTIRPARSGSGRHRRSSRAGPDSRSPRNQP